VLSTNLRSEPLLSPRHTLAAIIDQYLVKEPGFRAPVSLFRDTVSPPMAKALSSAEVIHLHGINGIVQLSQIRSRFPDTKIVWTLHDMNPFTGACHYSLGCQGFENDCSGDKRYSLCAVRRRLSAHLDMHVHNVHTTPVVTLQTVIAAEQWNLPEPLD